MTNKEIGLEIQQIAKILELKNPSDRFRIVAYERAAQTIENYSEDLTKVYERGGIKELEKVPNVGLSIAEKIEELIKTGKIGYLKEIAKDVPVNEVQFVKIPGIGPKTAVKIAQETKAKDIKELEKLIKQGKADKIFKEKTRENILRGIGILERMTGRMLITEALPIAEKVIDYLKSKTKLKKIDYVGSLRRFKETIGDIDIVAATDEPKKVIDEFVNMPGVINVLAQGNDKAIVIYQPNAQIDLEIVSEDEYGSLLQHFTGSKEHNIRLRSYALTINRSVSEHGIKIIKNGKETGEQIKCGSEKEVYENLKMDYIVPELREDKGEIEAALNHKLPKLIEPQDIKGDLHVHSKWSDGFMTIEEIAKSALELGYQYVVISDHTVGLGIANGLDEKRLEERQKEIDLVQKRFSNIRIFSSVEVNIKANGDLDIKDWMLKQLDLVTASVHTAFNQSKEVMTDRIIKAIKHPHVDIIGHPSGRIIGQREPYEVDWPRVFKACAESKTALEISAFPNRLDLKDSLCMEAKKYKVMFAISTDAHQRAHLDLMRYGIAVARRGWLTKNDCINTLEPAQLIEWSKRGVS